MRGLVSSTTGALHALLWVVMGIQVGPLGSVSVFPMRSQGIYIYMHGGVH